MAGKRALRDEHFLVTRRALLGGIGAVVLPGSLTLAAGPDAPAGSDRDAGTKADPPGRGRRATRTGATDQDQGAARDEVGFGLRAPGNYADKDPSDPAACGTFSCRPPRGLTNMTDRDPNDPVRVGRRAPPRTGVADRDPGDWPGHGRGGAAPTKMLARPARA